MHLVFLIKSLSTRHGRRIHSARIVIHSKHIAPTFSPFCSNRESAAGSLPKSSFRDLNYSSMANTGMALRVTSHVGKNSPLAPRNKKLFERSSRELPSIDSAKFSKTSGLDHLWKNLQTEWVLKRGLDLITNSRWTSSLKHCESFGHLFMKA